MNLVQNSTQARLLNVLHLIEAALLAAAAPFLLFPTFRPALTAAALLLVGLVWLTAVFRRALLPPLTPQNTPLLLFFLMLIVAILVTADPDLTLPKATGLVLGLAVWRWLALYAAAGRRFWWAVAGFVAAGIGFTLLGVLSADWLLKIPGIEDIVQRLPTGVVTLPESPDAGVQPNQIAGTALSWILLPPSLLLGWWAERGRSWRWWAALLLALGGTAVLILTQSRSGYIGFAGGALLLLLLWRAWLPAGSRIRRTVTAVAAAAIVGGSGFLLWLGPARIAALWRDPVQETALGSLSTIGFRQEVWRWAVTAAADFSFTGTGLGAFRQVVRRLYPLNVSPGYDIAHAHNIFLQTALDVGLPGLVAFVALLLVTAVMVWQIAAAAPALRPAALGLLASLAALHLFGLTDAVALGAKPGLLFWLALGLIAAMHRQAHSSLAK